MSAVTPSAVPDIATVQAMVDARRVEEEAALAPASAASDFAFNVADLLKLPRPSWRVKGVLPECGTAVIWGPSRAGKTFAALDLVLAMAQAREWLSWKTAACDVLYICLESVWGLQGRLKAWALEQNQNIPANVRFIIEPFDLLNREHLAAIKQAAPKHGVLVIDTLNRAAPGTDENSSRDMSNIINAAAEIQTAMAGLVLLVAHSGKDGTRGIRGHSSLFAALDASIEVGRNGDSRFVRLDKVKEAEDSAKRFFRLKPVVIGTDEDGEPITSCIVEAVEGSEAERLEADKPLSRPLQYALDSLRATIEKEQSPSVHVDAWRQHFYAGHPADTDAGKRQAFHRARKDLIEHGKIAVINNIYSVTERDNSVTCHPSSRPISGDDSVTKRDTPL